MERDFICLLYLVEILEVAVVQRFISHEHASNIFKKHLKDFHVDIPKEKKGGDTDDPIKKD